MSVVISPKLDFTPLGVMFIAPDLLPAPALFEGVELNLKGINQDHSAPPNSA